MADHTTEVREAGVDLRRHTWEIVRAASRAPSHHNAQPWSFQVRATEVEVHADPSRAMPAADPAGRQLFISVGAAVYGVRLALANLGLGTIVRPARDRSRPNLTAVVTAARRRAPAPAEARLYPELDRRRTVRGPFTDDSLPMPLEVELTSAAREEGVALHWVHRAGTRRELAALAAQAEREQQADPAFRAELARWVGPAAVADNAGIPYVNLGAVDIGRHAAEFPLRDFTGGDREAAVPTHEPEGHLGVVVLGTRTDLRADWIRAGQALHRLLLVASAAGHQASYLNQPLEIPRLRSRVRDILGLDDHPQLILRIGRPRRALPPPTPRRPIADVMLT
jgi:hypothetical protein